MVLFGQRLIDRQKVRLECRIMQRIVSETLRKNLSGYSKFCA